jgi:hypothetical protein
MNPIHFIQSSFFYIHISIILPFMSRSPRLVSSLWIFSNNLFARTSQLQDACYMPRPSHPPWFDNRDYIWGTVELAWSLCGNGKQKQVCVLITRPRREILKLHQINVMCLEPALMQVTQIKRSTICALTNLQFLHLVTNPARRHLRETKHQKLLQKN